jgi:hypothetical protein
VTVGIAHSRRETSAARNLPQTTHHASNRPLWHGFLREGWRGPPGVVLLLAVAVGTALRFLRLGARELSIDESLSWAESAGRSVSDVLRIQHDLDSGKFPIYELAQHYWMGVFGDGEAALRALPALIGSLSIVLVFVLAIEVMEAARLTSSDESAERRDYMIAAVCTLLFAVALPSVEIARQARMYSMMQAWILIEMIFVLRARRLGGLANYTGIAVFSAIAVATNFTAVLIVGVEGLWIIYLLLAEEQSDDQAPSNAPLLIGAALVAAMVLLLPFYAGLRYGVEGVKRGDYDWIAPPGPWEPLATFESALGTWVFPLFALLAVVGAIVLWRSHRDEAVLLVLWLALPPIALFAGSYIVTSMLVTRYLISSFIPLFILTAIAIEYLPLLSYRTLAILAVVSLSILRVSWDFRPGDHRWRDACNVALTNAGADRRVGVCHQFYVVSYYIHQAHRDDVQVVRVPLRAGREQAPSVVVVAPTAPPAQVAAIRREYPAILATFKNVVVVARADAPG